MPDPFYVVDRFKGWGHSGHVTLQRGEHSRLADHAAEVQVTGAGLKRTSALCNFHCSAQVFFRPLATSSMS
jgi:hypothetical protein